MPSIINHYEELSQQRRCRKQRELQTCMRRKLQTRYEEIETERRASSTEENQIGESNMSETHLRHVMRRDGRVDGKLTQPDEQKHQRYTTEMRQRQAITFRQILQRVTAHATRSARESERVSRV